MPYLETNTIDAAFIHIVNNSPKILKFLNSEISETVLISNLSKLKFDEFIYAFIIVDGLRQTINSQNYGNVEDEDDEDEGENESKVVNVLKTALSPNVKSHIFHAIFW